MKFIIICAARSGSTMLRHMLNSHPLILCHGEILKTRMFTRFFSRKYITGLEGNKGVLYQENSQFKRRWNHLMRHDMGAFIDQIVFDNDMNQEQAVGFKFKTDEFFLPAYQSLSTYIESNTDIAIIHLRRRNLLKQFISHYWVTHGLAPTVKFDQSFVANKEERVQLDVVEVRNYMDNLLDRERRIEERLKEHIIHNVWYEDLLQKEQTSIAGILDLLKVPHHPLTKKTQKIIHNHYEAISNIDEILGELRGLNLNNRIDLI